jgi:hypothetical protein
MDTADEGIERQFADGNSQAAEALIADAEYTFAVGHNNDIHFAIRAVAQKCGNRIPEWIRDEKAARRL